MATIGRGWRMARRSTLAAAFLLAIPGTGIAAEQRVLTLVNRPDNLAEDTIQKFEAETGIKVNLESYETDDVVLAGLRGAKPDWDLVLASTVRVIAKAGAEHLLQPVEPARLANYANVDPKLLAAVTPYDPGNRLGVPFLWGSSGLGINAAKAGPLLGGQPIDTLSLVFDPVQAQKLAACGVAIEDAPEDVIPAALAFLGLDPTSQDEKDLNRAAEVLARVKPYVKRLSANDFADALAGGTICVGLGSSVEVSDAEDRADERDTGVVLTYQVPRERARMWVDELVIPVRAAHAAEARQFIDFLLRPEVASDVSEWTGAAVANSLAAGFGSDDEQPDETLFPSEATRARLFLAKPPTPEWERVKVKIWARTKP